MQAPSQLWEQARIAVRDRDEAALRRVEARMNTVPRAERNALEAQLMVARGDEAGARRKLIRTSKERPLEPTEKLILGFLLIEDAPKAKKIFSAVARAKLSDPRVAEGLGVTSIDTGETEKGLRHLERAVRDDGKSWSALFALGLGHLKNEDPEAAGAAFGAAARLRPDYEPAWLGFARAAVMSGCAAEASRILGPLVEAAPNRPRLRLAYADCLAHAGDLARACAVLDPMARTTKDVELLCDFAQLCIRGAFVGPAKRALNRVAKLQPHHPRLAPLQEKLDDCSRN